MNTFIIKKIEENETNLSRACDNLIDTVSKKNEQRDQINKLVDDIQDLAKKADLNLQMPEKLPHHKVSGELDELINAASVIPEEHRKKLKKDIFDSVSSVPPFDKFDLFTIIGLSGLVLLADWLLVGLPPKTKWVSKNEGGIIPTGWLSKRLKSWNVGNDNWLAKICKVPYDKVNLPIEGSGFNPVNHRVLSFGHDPSPIGMVFGLIDIASGGMSGITRDGQLFHIPGVPPSIGRIIMAPLLWIGHLASDVATPMGIPVPGWSLTQLLRIPAPGAPGEATIADVGRMMFEQGYDFRHYLAGGVVPALIEIVIRTYHFVRYSYPQKNNKKTNLITSNLAENYINELNVKGHLNAMLFWTHATAAAINSGKVVVQGATSQNYFSAVRAINIAEWQMFAFRTIEYLAYRFRDKKVEQITGNRKLINERWDYLSKQSPYSLLISEEDAPSLKILERGEV